MSSDAAAKQLLGLAMHRLNKFYNTELYKASPKRVPSEEDRIDFEAYKKTAASGGATGMIRQILNAAKAMEAETIRSEDNARKA